MNRIFSYWVPIWFIEVAVGYSSAWLNYRPDDGIGDKLQPGLTLRVNWWLPHATRQTDVEANGTKEHDGCQSDK